jgi:hypothetical protein
VSRTLPNQRQNAPFLDRDVVPTLPKRNVISRTSLSAELDESGCKCPCGRLDRRAGSICRQSPASLLRGRRGRSQDQELCASVAKRFPTTETTSSYR